jgi:hypothetical protein
MRGRIYQTVNGWPGWPSSKSVMVHDRCIHEEWRYIHCLAQQWEISGAYRLALVDMELD